MKRFKRLAVILALLMVMQPITQVNAEGLSPVEGHRENAPEPTPAGQLAEDVMDKNITAFLTDSASDYVGRIKKAIYNVNGDECTVVEKIGVGAYDEELPEGMSEIEFVYHESFAPKNMTKSDYTSTILSNTRSYYRNGNLVANVYEDYEVWYYSTGKVDLAGYSLGKSTASGYGSSDFVYGSVVNTDGSVSYTSGFQFEVRGTFCTAVYDINLIVTPSYYSFY